MDLLSAVYKLIGILSVPLVIVSVVMMVRSIGRARYITRKSLLIQLVTSPAFLVLYMLLMGISVAAKWAVPLVMVGMGVGGFWGLGTALSVRNSRVFGTRSVWYLWLWLATFVLTQMLALLSTDGATAGGMATMCFSMGTAVGMNGGLLLRHRQILPAVGGNAT
jgi:hypothetical protein